MSIRLSESRRAGFTLIELIIVISILGILAALVIPKFTDASVLAQVSATQDQLRSTRTALLRYQVDHNDTYPDIADMWGALTGKSDLDGTLNAAGDYGPYLMSAPENPFTLSSSVVAFGAGTSSDGWEYDVTQQPPFVAVGFNETTKAYTAP